MNDKSFYVINVNQSCRVAYRKDGTVHIFPEKLTALLAHLLVDWLNSLEISKGDQNESS